MWESGRKGVFFSFRKNPPRRERSMEMILFMCLSIFMHGNPFEVASYKSFLHLFRVFFYFLTHSFTFFFWIVIYFHPALRFHLHLHLRFPILSFMICSMFSIFFVLFIFSFLFSLFYIFFISIEKCFAEIVLCFSTLVFIIVTSLSRIKKVL